MFDAQNLWEIFNAGALFGFMTGAVISLVCVFHHDVMEMRKADNK